MATTMKKAEILSTAKSNIIGMILPEGARQIGASTFALPTEVDGVTCWVKVAFTCASPIATDKVPAFDIDLAVEKWNAECAEKAQKAAEKARKAEEKRAADAERRAKREAEKATKG